MKESNNFYFKSYNEWHSAITGRCNLKLTREFTNSRIAALQDTNDPHTREFATKYGEAYLQQVIQWYQQSQQ